MDVEEYGRIAKAEDCHWWYRAVRALLADIARGMLGNRTGRFLDAGCGPGGNSSWITGDFCVYGVDISSDAVNFCSLKRPRMRVVQGSVTALPFDNCSFDGIQSITVVCHEAVHSVEAALSEYNRVLRGGGLLLMIEPAFDIFRRSHDRVVHAGRRFRLSELSRTVQKSGFEVAGSTYFFASLAPAALALSLLDRVCNRRSHTSDLERSHALDRAFEFLASIELKLAAKALRKGRRSPILFGTSAVIVARKP